MNSNFQPFKTFCRKMDTAYDIKKLHSEKINGEEEYSHTAMQLPVRYLRVRRVVELLFTIMVSPIALMIILLVLPFIVLESRGSIFYTELRPGKFGIPLTIFKLRTMYQHLPDRSLTAVSDAR